MKLVRAWIAAAFIVTTLAACSPAVPAGPTAAPTQAAVPTDTVPPPAPTETEPAVPGLSFEAATYENSTAGFALEYPRHWTVGPDEQYSRGGITAFTSWTRPTDVLPGEAPPGETRLDVTVQLWDPVNDLEAFLAQRKGAWEASGNQILSEERSSVEGGGASAAFVVEATDGTQAYFFLTTLSDAYLVLSGTGDLALLAEIAGTLKMLPLAY